MSRVISACLIVGALAAVTPAIPQDADARSRITTASGVRVRAAPQTVAAEVGRLQLGAVVRELERSAVMEKVGGAEDYWYRVAAPGGGEGWVFGGLTAPFATARRDEIYLKLAGERLANAAASFSELAETSSGSSNAPPGR